MDIAEIEATLEDIRGRYYSRQDGFNQDVGTAGSGNWGHAGRQGIRGGSAPGGGKLNRYPSYSGKYMSAAKEWRDTYERARNSPSMQPHTATADELKSLSMTAKVRVTGTGRKKNQVFYSNGAGKLVNPKTGETLDVRSMKKNGMQIAYMPPTYKGGALDDQKIMRQYSGRKIPPEDKRRVEVEELSAKTSEGMEIQGKNGKTYKAINGKWCEVGPGGIIKNPKDLPVSSRNKDLLSGTVTANLYDLRLRANGVSEEEVSRFQSIMSKADPKIKNAYAMALTYVGVKSDVKEEGTAYYSPYEECLHLKKYNSPAETVLHEIAHYIDNEGVNKGILKENPTLAVEKSMSKPFEGDSGRYVDLWHADEENIAKEIGLEVNPGTNVYTQTKKPRIADGEYDVLYKVTKWGKRELAGLSKRNSSQVSDILDGITEGRTLGMNTFGGHKKEYWNLRLSTGHAQGSSEKPNCVEGWAQFLSLKAQNDEKALKIVEKVAPNFYREMNAAYERAFAD